MDSILLYIEREIGLFFRDFILLNSTNSSIYISFVLMMDILNVSISFSLGQSIF